MRVAVDGVTGEDFWKKPRMDFWFFIFCVLEDDRFRAPVVGVAATDGEDAAAALPLAMAELWKSTWQGRVRFKEAARKKLTQLTPALTMNNGKREGS